MQPAAPSPAEQHARSLSKEERDRQFNALPEEEAQALAYDWTGWWARPTQIPPPGDWRTWLIMAGRGFGKTRTGAEWVRAQIEVHGRGRGALVGATAADVRDVMIEGESGILATAPPWNRPTYEPSKRRLTWASGAMATAYSADEPGRLRGPQHDFAWADELAAWRYPDAWDQLMFGLRLGTDPRACVTTTPRPKQLIRELREAATTHVTTGSTYDNAANLAPAFLEAILAKYEGTTLGMQEIHAHLLDESPGALWLRSTIERDRVAAAPELRRIIVAVDPAVTANASSDETGIIVVGLGAFDDHAYVLHDGSIRASVDQWAKAAVWAYHQHEADRIIGEVNNGGDLVEAVIRQQDHRVPFKAVRASRGKHARAEPIAALYEQGKVHHVGAFPQLEDQMATWAPGSDESPDRMDALVWGVHHLMLDGKRPRFRSLAS